MRPAYDPLMTVMAASVGFSAHRTCWQLDFVSIKGRFSASCTPKERSFSQEFTMVQELWDCISRSLSSAPADLAKIGHFTDGV